jgi:predicted phosphodiesterase
LGDIVESVTGYNKIETLKEMEQGLQGGNLIISAYEIIHKFARSINNLQEINMISGNHDRLTPDKAMDKDGGAAQLVAYMLSKDIKTNWHPLVIKRIIDNICYLLMHGDHKLARQDLGKLIFEYGDQSLYNVLLSGHWHTRKSTKLFRESNLVLADTSKYRAITVSPIVTENRWVEENGWSCSAGVTITEASKDKRNINYYDIALSR